jgi:hypothetical protein
MVFILLIKKFVVKAGLYNILSCLPLIREFFHYIRSSSLRFSYYWKNCRIYYAVILN